MKVDRQFFYDYFAPKFDAEMNMYDLNKRVAIVFNELLRGVNLKNKKLLDAGCGTGWFSKNAYKMGADVTALDIGENLLKKVKEKCPVNTVHGDVLKLPFKDNSFDVVIASEVIEHTKNPKKAVSEIIRVTKKGGRIALTAPNALWHFSVPVAEVLNLRPYRGYENWLSYHELKNLFEKNNCHILLYKGFHLAPVFPWKIFHPILNYLDRYGRHLKRFMFNFAISSDKK